MLRVCEVKRFDVTLYAPEKYTTKKLHYKKTRLPGLNESFCVVHTRPHSLQTSVTLTPSEILIKIILNFSDQYWRTDPQWFHTDRSDHVLSHWQEDIWTELLVCDWHCNNGGWGWNTWLVHESRWIPPIRHHRMIVTISVYLPRLRMWRKPHREGCGLSVFRREYKNLPRRSTDWNRSSSRVSKEEGSRESKREGVTSVYGLKLLVYDTVCGLDTPVFEVLSY